MSTKHTPGNWFVDVASSGLRVLTDDRRATIICQEIGPPSNPAAQADARLIAAAPELLEALRGLLSEANSASKPLHEYSEWSNKARSAIAKATGEQP